MRQRVNGHRHILQLFEWHFAGEAELSGAAVGWKTVPELQYSV